MCNTMPNQLCGNLQAPTKIYRDECGGWAVLLGVVSRSWDSKSLCVQNAHPGLFGSAVQMEGGLRSFWKLMHLCESDPQVP